VIAATVTAAWLMRDLPLATIAVAIAVGVPAAAGAGVYGRRLALGA